MTGLAGLAMDLRTRGEVLGLLKAWERWGIYMSVGLPFHRRITSHFFFLSPSRFRPRGKGKTGRWRASGNAGNRNPNRNGKGNRKRNWNRKRQRNRNNNVKGNYVNSYSIYRKNKKTSLVSCSPGISLHYSNEKVKKSSK